jgi:hypothetical protein
VIVGRVNLSVRIKPNQEGKQGGDGDRTQASKAIHDPPQLPVSFFGKMVRTRRRPDRPMSPLRRGEQPKHPRPEQATGVPRKGGPSNPIRWIRHVMMASS